MPASKPWSADDVATLRRMVAENASATMIGKALNRTREAVNGKAFALKLTFTFRKARAQENSAPLQISAPGRRPTVHTRPLTPKEFENASMIPAYSHDYAPWEERKPGQCAAPVGVFNGVTHSCCRPTHSWKKAGRLVESSYCPEHHRLFFYVPATTARDLERSITRLRSNRKS